MSSGSMDSSPSSSPGSQAATAITIPNGAPKFGTLVPNRVFVGGISSTTTESELHQLFSAFGNVKQTKIIQDRAGVSKGYGFVTFETEEEARRLQVEADNIVLKERKLNIAPAIKKQQTYCSRTYEMGQPILNGGYYYSPSGGTPYTYQNGMAMFTSDTGQQAATLGLLQQLPGKGGSPAPASTFPLLYGPGHTAMFLPGQPSLAPSPATAAQAAAVASATQQQLQLQTAQAHINNVAAAAQQTQSPSRDGSSGRDSGSTTGGVAGNQAWRWTGLAGSGTSGVAASVSPGCGAGQQAAAVQAAALHTTVTGQLAQQTNASQQLQATQGLNYAQGANSGFLHPLETFHYIPSVFSTGLHHPAASFVIPDRQTNY